MIRYDSIHTVQKRKWSHVKSQVHIRHIRTIDPVTSWDALYLNAAFQTSASNPRITAVLQDNTPLIFAPCNNKDTLRNPG